MANKVTYGLKNVHYAVATESQGSWTYGTPVALEGAQEFSATILGGKSDVYADDKVIATTTSYSGQDITLKFTELSDQFKKDVLGYIEQDNSLIEITNAGVVTFALGFEIAGDAKRRRVWYYLCSATPVGDSTKSTTDTVEVNSVQLAITARPITSGNYDIIRVIKEQGQTGYDTFLTTAPTVPAISL